jgi:hypothetical protein
LHSAQAQNGSPEKNNESTCCGFQQNSTIASGSDTVLFRLDEAIAIVSTEV